jgi:hypothetical protein
VALHAAYLHGEVSWLALNKKFPHAL